MPPLPGLGRGEFNYWETCPIWAEENLIIGRLARNWQAGIWIMVGLPGLGMQDFDFRQACPGLAGENLVYGKLARIWQAGIWFAAGLPGLNKRKMLQGKYG